MTTRPKIQQLHQSGATDGQVPVWDAALGHWVPDTPAGSGASPLTTKGDVYVYGTADDRLPVGSNGQVLTADSAVALGVKWATPSTGIDDPAVFEAEWGTTPLGADLEFDGSTVALPSGWSWVNQGDSSYEEFADYGYAYVASTGGSTGSETHRMLVRTIPSDSSFRAFFHVADLNGPVAAWTRWGIVLRESSSGKYLLWGPAANSSAAWAANLSEWSATNTFSSDVMLEDAVPTNIRYVQVRKVSATSWRFYTSGNGRVWSPWWVGYDPSGFGVTFDEIGMLFGVNNSSPTDGMDVELGWFRIR